MPANKTRKRLQDRLVNDVADLKRQQAQAKTPQKNGADVLPVATGFGSVGPVTIANNSAHSFVFTAVAEKPGLTLWNFLLTPYIDAHDTDHRWPNGAAITLTMLSTIVISALQDYHDADLAQNIQVYKITVTNFDISSHDLYFDLLIAKPLIG